ncbi:hypothetical protein FA13DRAFT_169298 [Coprinellus micaceus]|uniref:Uncharacterized protein n=1 Tax=Coprinellus micaceus TaxID=71717 RepID=A0A4Y7SHF0_COPMI|nr:hypothetical protein FA13DRAFT_169298 [Coprinellus micaceus]
MVAAGCFVAERWMMNVDRQSSLPSPSGPRKVCTKERSAYESYASPGPGVAQASRRSARCGPHRRVGCVVSCRWTVTEIVGLRPVVGLGEQKLSIAKSR